MGNYLIELEEAILKLLGAQPYSDIHPPKALTLHEIHHRILLPQKYALYQTELALDNLLKKGLIECPDTIVRMIGSITITAQGYQLTTTQQREEFREREIHENEILQWQTF